MTVPDHKIHNNFTKQIEKWLREYQPTILMSITPVRLRSILSFIAGKDAFKAANILVKGGWNVNEELVKILVGYYESKGNRKQNY